MPAKTEKSQPAAVTKDVMNEIMRRRQMDSARENADAGDYDPDDLFNVNEPDFPDEGDMGGGGADSESLSVIRGDLSRILDLVRYSNNTIMAIESNANEIMQALGLDSGKGGGAKKPLMTPETVAAITETRDLLKRLDEYGFKAQLSESFECFKPENMEKIFNNLDRRVDALSKLGKTYEAGLSSALARAQARGAMTGAIWGSAGGAVAAALILFGARFLGL